MSNLQHLQAALQRLESIYGADAIYDYFSAFYDVIVHGHTSSDDDNPHLSEEPGHVLYWLGARAAERLRGALETHHLSQATASHRRAGSTLR